MWTRSSYDVNSRPPQVNRPDIQSEQNLKITPAEMAPPLFADTGQTLRPSADSQSTLNGNTDYAGRNTTGSRHSGMNTLSVAFVDTPRSSPSALSPPIKIDETAVDNRGHNVQSRFRQFLVEGFTGSRSRTKSENHTLAPDQSTNTDSTPLRQSVALTVTDRHSPTLLPPHAHTVTGGSSQATSLLRRLAAYTANVSSPQSEQASIRSGVDSLKRYGFLYHMLGAGSRSGSVPIPPLPAAHDKLNRRPKSPRFMIGRLMSTSSVATDKSSDDIVSLPNPSKLPKEEPVSSLEFTKSRLKNPKKISQKFQVKSGFDVLKRKRAGSLSAGGDRRSLISAPSTNPTHFLLDHLSKSEENLISVTSLVGKRPQAVILVPRSSLKPNLTKGPSARHHHHHHHHHHSWRRHGNHGHHRNRDYFPHQGYPSTYEAHTMTRVTESRRYLMFTRSLPFWSAKQYMETHGTGLGVSETYAVLFHHTPCYELIPNSAKLVVLDSQLTISKAFRALIYNEIRAAPVWHSAKQTVSAMLTVTDFVHMLNMCWSAASAGSDDCEAGPKPASDITDFDRLTIHRWKEYTRTKWAARSNMSNTLATESGAIRKPTTSGVQLPVSCPTSNLSSPSGSRSRSLSSSSSSSSATSLPPDLSAIPVSSVEDEESGSVKHFGHRRSDAFLQSFNSHSSRVPFARLMSVYPEDTLLKAVRVISRFRVHHLPVIDCPNRRTGNILYILTPHQILSYLYARIPHLPQPRFLQSSLNDLNVGTYGRVAMVTLSTTLRDALRLFAQEHVSAFPVVDSLDTRRLVNVFSKYDVITLVLSGAYKNPELTIKEWLDVCKTHNPSSEDQHAKPPVEVCLISNNLLYVIDKLIKTGFRSLVVVNNRVDYRVEGVVTLSDVLRFTVIKQAKSLSFYAQPPSVAEVADEHEHESVHQSNRNNRCVAESDIIPDPVTARSEVQRQKTKVRLASPKRHVDDSTVDPRMIRNIEKDGVSAHPRLRTVSQLEVDVSNSIKSATASDQTALSSV